MDDLDFLDGASAPNAETQPVEAPSEQQAEPVAAEPEASEEQPQETEAQSRERDERGRFKAKDEPIMVPLQALHETRDEVKALKAKLEALQPRQAPPQAPQVPDIFENPEGYQAHIQNQMSQIALDTRLNLSEEMVRQSAGDEAVNAAQEWAKQQLPANPALAQAFYSSRNPYGFLVQQHQRQTLVSQLGDDPKQIEAFLAWKAAQGAQQSPPQPTPTPTGSIASATSAGGVQHAAIGPQVAFDDFFKR